MVVFLASSQTNVKEYVYFGSRLVATENSVSSLSISPSTWTLPPTSGSSTIFVYASSGVGWTATTSTSWIHLTAPTSSSGENSVAFTFDANSTSAVRTGTITVGAAVEVITQLASTPAAPTNVSATANPTSGADSTFTFKFSSAGGPTYINWFQAIINSSLATSGACHFIYGATEDYLTIGTGSSSGSPLWHSRARPGAQTTLDNGVNCSIDMRTVQKTTVNSTTMSLTMKIHFYPVMTGTRYAYMIVSDNAGNVDTNGWENKATYVPYPTAAPTVGTVSPSNGSGSSATFSTQFIDANGATALTDMFLMVSPVNTPTVNNSCWTYYNSGFALMSDTTVTWMGPDGSGNVENSQCKLFGSGSSVTRSGNIATLTTNLSFKNAYAGTRYLWAWAQDSGGNTGWVQKGTWTVPPSSGVGVTITQGNGFTPPYFLAVSQTSTFSASVTGTSNTAVNWSYTLNGGPLQINGTPNGNSYTISTFSFMVPQVITLTATSVADPNVSASVDLTLVPDATRPYGMTMAPNGSTVNKESYVTYSMTVSNSTGASNVRWVQPHYSWVSPMDFYGFVPGQPAGQSNSFGCHLLYDAGSNTLYLDNEAGNSNWVSSGVIGASSVLSNSICSVDLLNSSVSAPANNTTMQLNLRLKITGSFPGNVENIYMSSANNSFVLNPSFFLGWWWMGTNTLP